MKNNQINSHELFNKFEEQFWTEFQDLQKLLPCKHRKVDDFEQSCDICLIYILPKTINMFCCSARIIEFLDAYIQMCNFYIGANDRFMENVFNGIKNNIELPAGMKEADTASMQYLLQIETIKKILLSHKLLKPNLFTFKMKDK